MPPPTTTMPAVRQPETAALLPSQPQHYEAVPGGDDESSELGSPEARTSQLHRMRSASLLKVVEGAPRPQKGGAAFNPFVNGRQEPGVVDWIKMVVLLPLALVRLLLAALCILLGAPFAYLSLAGYDPGPDEALPAPLSCWRAALFFPMRVATRGVLFAMGFMYIRVKGHKVPATEAPLLLPNHVGQIEPLFLMSRFGVSHVAKAETKDLPLVGCARAPTPPPPPRPCSTRMRCAGRWAGLCSRSSCGAAAPTPALSLARTPLGRSRTSSSAARRTWAATVTKHCACTRRRRRPTASRSSTSSLGRFTLACRCSPASSATAPTAVSRDSLPLSLLWPPLDPGLTPACPCAPISFPERRGFCVRQGSTRR